MLSERRDTDRMRPVPNLDLDWHPDPMITVRPASPLDQDAVRALGRIVHQVSNKLDLDPLHDLVAEEDGEVLGWIRVTFGECLDEIGRTGAWIQTMAVFPDSQGRGIGGLLVGAAEDHALQAGDRVIACQPIEDGSLVRRLKFFTRLGYESRGDPDLEGFWAKELSV